MMCSMQYTVEGRQCVEKVHSFLSPCILSIYLIFDFRFFGATKDILPNYVG